MRSLLVYLAFAGIFAFLIASTVQCFCTNVCSPSNPLLPPPPD